MKDNDTRLERILEQGISSYTHCEPLAGLEERIMARLHLAERPRERTQRRWAALAAGLALLIVGVSIYWPMRHVEPKPVRIAAAETKTPPFEPIQAPNQPPRIRKPMHRSRQVDTLPKRAVFPTPSPLTPEERRLLAMVQQDPEGTVQAFESLRKRASEPLEIAPLVIPPVEPADDSGKGNL